MLNGWLNQFEDTATIKQGDPKSKNVTTERKHITNVNSKNDKNMTDNDRKMTKKTTHKCSNE